MLVEKLQQGSPDIDVLTVPGDRWKAFTDGLHELYMEPDSGTTLPNHVFTFGHDPNKPTSYLRQTYRDSPKLEKDLMPSKRSKRASKNLTPEERANEVVSLYDRLEVLGAPKVSDQKQYELHFTVAKHVPEEHRHAYPCPPQDVIDRVKPPKEEGPPKKKAKLDGEVKVPVDPSVEIMMAAAPASADQPNDTEMASI